MQVTYYFNIKEGKVSDFIEWVRDNEQAMTEHAPKGWSYAGTWFTVQGFGEYDVEQRWGIEDYGNLGDSFGNEEFQRLIVETVEYLEQHPSMTTLTKSASDVQALSGF